MNRFTIKQTHSSIQPQEEQKNIDETSDKTTESQTNTVSDTKGVSNGGMAIRATSTLQIDSF
jgi:hypothetical protein